MQHHSDLLQRASQEIAIHFGYWNCSTLVLY
jgi:hypothetical protein